MPVAAVVVGVAVALVQDDEGLSLVMDGELIALDDDET